MAHLKLKRKWYFFYRNRLCVIMQPCTRDIQKANVKKNYFHICSTAMLLGSKWFNRSQSLQHLFWYYVFKISLPSYGQKRATSCQVCSCCLLWSLENCVGQYKWWIMLTQGVCLLSDKAFAHCLHHAQVIVNLWMESFGPFLTQPRPFINQLLLLFKDERIPGCKAFW